MPQLRPCRQRTTAVSNNYGYGGVAIICAKSAEKLHHPNERNSWKSGRSERANSSPACCQERHEYPPGYTVFECRLDGNQPIAQMVQVPPNTTDNILQNKTCMLLETKQSEFGPTSRVAAYPAQTSPRTSHNRPQPTGAMSFALEARDSPSGAVACAGKFAEHLDERSAISFLQPVTTLEVTKCPACPNGPSSRLVYGPVPEAVVKPSGTYRTPALYIECTTTPEGPIARVTQVPREFTKSSGDPGTCYGTFVKHDGTCPTATVTQSNRKNESGAQKTCEFLETWVDPSGPRARALTLPEGFSNVRHFTHLQVHPNENGPSAKISQHPGDLKKKITNLRSNHEKLRPSNLCRNYQSSSPVTRCQSPLKLPTVSRFKTMANDAIPQVTERRNGLSPTPSELKGRMGSFKDSRIRKRTTGAGPKTCPAHCCPPVSSVDQGQLVCKVQPAPCAPKRSPSSAKRSGSPVHWARPCFCLAQPRFKSPIHSRSEMHPLPGGTVFSQCPAPSLPEIAPVPLGPNRLRDYKPRTKTLAPRRTTGSSPTRAKQPPKVNGKSKRPTNSARKKTKKKEKNKKTGPSEEIIETSDSSDEDKEKELTTVSEETLYVECPAFASKAIQPVRVPEDQSCVECPAFASKAIQPVRVPEDPSCVQCPAFASKAIQSVRVGEDPSYDKCPAFESKGNQAVRVGEDPSYDKCPAFESKGNQAVLICEEPSHIKCPAFESKGNQTLLICEEPTYVKCPAFESKRIRSVHRFEEPTYVTCPAFASGKSSRASTMYVPREDLLNVKYPEYFSRTKRLDTRNSHELQDQCHLPTPESVFRISYEQRQNRQARTLVSSGRRRRRFEDEFNEAPRRGCCVRA